MSKYFASVVIKNSSAYLQHKGYFFCCRTLLVFFFNLEYFKNTFGFLLLCRKLFHSTYFL